MNVEAEFEHMEADRARLDGFESILAAVVDMLVADDRRAQGELGERLDLIRAMLRAENAHFETIGMVERFHALVTDRHLDPVPADGVAGCRR